MTQATDQKEQIGLQEARKRQFPRLLSNYNFPLKMIIRQSCLSISTDFCVN